MHSPASHPGHPSTSPSTYLQYVRNSVLRRSLSSLADRWGTRRASPIRSTTPWFRS
jgi:hypothetical protein